MSSHFVNWAFVSLLIIVMIHSSDEEVTYHSGDHVEVTTTSGKLRGFTQQVLGQTVDTFLGIPFAKPPIGKLRFQPPVAKESWEGLRDALTLPNSCYQTIDTYFDRFPGVEMWNPNTNMSEDCLYLNVWVPRLAEGEKVTTMVWIYGGAFNAGTSTLDWYDGKYLASQKRVMVISMNYRLGVLGFLSFGEKEIPGNMGLSDQQMALQWISKNVEKFGGDPGDVTLFSESAGSASVHYHLLAKGSQGLFQRAIFQSATALGHWAFMEQERAKSRAHQLASHLSCNQARFPEILDCLRGKPAQEVTDAQWGIPPLLVPMSPVADGTFINDSPRNLLEAKNFPKVDILTGVVRNEGIYFLAYLLPKYLGTTTNGSVPKEQYISTISDIAQSKNPIVVDSVRFEYEKPMRMDPAVRNNDVLDKVLGDTAFKCNVAEFTQFMAMAGKGKVYQYQFMHRTSINPWPEWMGVMHGYEIDYIFGIPLNASLGYMALEKRLSGRMMTYWSNFAKTGNPNCDDKDKRRCAGRDKWPEYTSAKRENLVIDTDKDVVSYGLRVDQCAFMEEYIPQLKSQLGVMARTGCQTSGVQSTHVQTAGLTVFFLLLTSTLFLTG